NRYFTRRAGTCYACPIPCFNMVEVNEGKYAGLKYSSGTRIGFTLAWGATCAIDNLPAIWKCMELCGRFGMDYVSTTGSIAFALELFQRGIISETDTGGLKLTWGNEDAIVKLLHLIAFREGFGDILADGAVQAARKIGKGTEQYAMVIKGREMAWIDPRSGTKGWVFGYLTNPRGGDNVKNTHFFADLHNSDWWVDKFDMFDDVKAQIYRMPPQETATAWEGKPMMCKWFEDLYSALNSLGLCFFPAGFLLTWGPTHLSELYSAYTGWETTPQDIMRMGERVFNVFKACTARQGLTRQNDHFPDRFYTEPMPEGPAKGAILSRETIDQLLDEYYELRGWDKETGLPTREKLADLGLSDIANDLRQRGKLPPLPVRQS
ncbi:aldehyde ferredoxin oxidoreductase C-terminal domain-containing protein, partial [Chloroflexota bacterium]